MHFQGILAGLFVFILIGALHILVVKVEYHFGAHLWPLFLLLGLAGVGSSLFVEDTFFCIILAISGFLIMYTAWELIKQKERVERGWFPQNPKRNSNKRRKQ